MSMRGVCILKLHEIFSFGAPRPHQKRFGSGEIWRGGVDSLCSHPTDNRL